jgi:hypothetical protein
MDCPPAPALPDPRSRDGPSPSPQTQARDRPGRRTDGRLTADVGGKGATGDGVMGNRATRHCQCRVGYIRSFKNQYEFLLKSIRGDGASADALAGSPLVSAPAEPRTWALRTSRPKRFPLAGCPPARRPVGLQAVRLVGRSGDQARRAVAAKWPPRPGAPFGSDVAARPASPR